MSRPSHKNTSESHRAYLPVPTFGDRPGLSWRGLGGFPGRRLRRIAWDSKDFHSRILVAVKAGRGRRRLDEVCQARTRRFSFFGQMWQVRPGFSMAVLLGRPGGFLGLSAKGSHLVKSPLEALQMGPILRGQKISHCFFARSMSLVMLAAAVSIESRESRKELWYSVQTQSVLTSHLLSISCLAYCCLTYLTAFFFIPSPLSPSTSDLMLLPCH